MMIKVVIKY